MSEYRIYGAEKKFKVGFIVVKWCLVDRTVLGEGQFHAIRRHTIAVQMKGHASPIDVWRRTTESGNRLMSHGTGTTPLVDRMLNW